MNSDEMTQPIPRNYSLEVAVARLEERLASMDRNLLDFRVETKMNHSELAASMQALESRERERNGHVADLVRYRNENEQHWGEHMAWAANQVTDLNAQGDALAALEAARHEGAIKTGVWKSQAKFVLGGGGGGSLITAAVAGALWFFKVL